MPGKMDFDAYKAFAKGNKKEMSFDAYKGYAKAMGRDAMDEDDYKKASHGYGDPEGGPLSKSEGVNADNLRKAMDAYDAVDAAVSMCATSRESILRDKLADGTITKSEQSELGHLLSGDSPADRGDTIRKSMEYSDPDAAGLVDASDFLKSLVDTLDDRLESIGHGIAQDGLATRTLLKSQGSLIKSMGRVMVEQDELLKAQSATVERLNRRLDHVEGTPQLRKSHGKPDPRDVRARQTGERGTAGRGGGDDSDKLSKSQIHKGLRDLMIKADNANDQSARESLAHASALYESTGVVKRNVYAAIEMELA